MKLKILQMLHKHIKSYI